ncbi:MAG: hypothetical protein ABSF52_01770 [Syntrophobacteraceae bacterium]|jgi:hypothetical protein
MKSFAIAMLKVTLMLILSFSFAFLIDDLGSGVFGRFSSIGSTGLACGLGATFLPIWRREAKFQARFLGLVAGLGFGFIMIYLLPLIAISSYQPGSGEAMKLTVSVIVGIGVYVGILGSFFLTRYTMNRFAQSK